MSVIGIDIGNRYSTIAQAKRGGIDIILNENSKRVNSSMVSFQGKERFACEAAVPLERSNYKNTVKSLKRLIGRKFSDPSVQAELENFIHFKVVPLADDEIGVQVMYDGETRTFPPQQVMGMLLNKLKGIANDANPAAPVADAVLSVPPYFTDAQRHALLDAAQIGGINCLRLLNEPTAAALAYGIFKSARGAFSSEERRLVMFLDMGETHFTASIVGFWQGKCKVLSTVTNTSLGSRSFDLTVAKFFAETFRSNTGEDVWTKPKARLKLLKAAEKAKKTLSPEGVPQARVNIECLSGDNDLSMVLTEEKFEELAQPLLVGVEGPIAQAFELAQVADATALHSVEIVGGGMRSRVAKVKVAGLLNLQGKAPNYGLRTTLNMDECIARGCALQCAVLSPQFRISKEFKVLDVVPYPIRVTWEQGATDDMELVEDENEADGATNSVVLYKQGDEFPRMRRVTFRRRTGFTIDADYEETKTGTQLAAGVSRSVGKFTIANPPEDALPADGSAPKIRVNFNYDMSGVFAIHSAQVFKAIAPEPEPASAEAPPADADGDVKMDADKPAADTPPAAAQGAGEGDEAAKKAAEEKSNADAAETPKADPPAAAAAPAEEKAAPKVKYTKVSLNIDFAHPGYTSKQLMEAVELEAQMQQQDRIIREMQAKRNELETYIYDSRGALYDLGSYMTPQDNEAVSNFLDESENWLYDAFEATKKEYQSKLDDVKSKVEPIKARRNESMNRSAAVSQLRSVCDDFKRVANSTEERLAHLTDDDRNKIRVFVANAEAWLDGQLAAQEKLSMTVDPVLTCKDLQNRAAQLRRECNPIANKPKPAPKPKEEAKKPEAAEPAAADATPAAEPAEGASDGAGAGAGAGAGDASAAEASADGAAPAAEGDAGADGAKSGEADMEVDG